MTANGASLSWVAARAPWVTLGLLVVLPFVLPNRIVDDEAAARRQAEIAQAMRQVPFFVGDWIGKKEEVPREAQKLLRPNAILSREYRRPGEAKLHLLVVHCSDARDMIGHYPPICYPSSGWVGLGTRHDVDLTVNGRVLTMRSYRFQRAGEHGVAEVIRIFNAFVLPDGTVTPDIADINRQSERLALSVQGVAQVQVISSDGMDPAEACAATADLLTGLPALLASLGIGQGGTDDA